ncbi:hypothetical protein [Acinetobacter haemolyticus]|uniref:hypothetical protein n=1 Tax=Acinetobacter haemolyticus TaxID=29430 RepID=UPI0002D01364|nr:hypothetical protein [Acinetobacter haemolyticus]ENW19547.1 hypothetical protein F926_02296 [Acinetobacter haemolyticus NIPH 261]
MSNSPNQIPVFIHPAIKNLNVRQISKMIATKIIETTALQLHFNSSFCNQLSVADHLNTYEAVTYFIDNQFFEKYGFNSSESLINFHEVYGELLNEFKGKVKYSLSINE